MYLFVVTQQQYSMSRSLEANLPTIVNYNIYMTGSTTHLHSAGSTTHLHSAGGSTTHIHSAGSSVSTLNVYGDGNNVNFGNNNTINMTTADSFDEDSVFRDEPP